MTAVSVHWQGQRQRQQNTNAHKGDSFVTDPFRFRLGVEGGPLKIGKEVNKKDDGSGETVQGKLFVSLRSESDGERCVWDKTVSVFPVYLPCV